QAAPDIDADGITVIDIFVGYSEKSLPYVQDKDAYALMQIATVNNALKNSRIDNVRVRLVGTGVTNQHMGMASEQLPRLKDWFAADIAKYSPDVVAAFMIPDARFQNEATGWGYVNGYYNVNDVRSPNAFRHELGHNIGGVHCNDGAGYNFGYNNGMSRTHQCGNDINYYSTPNVTDKYGLAIGDANTANMAKIWRDNAARHSSHRPAVVPFEDEARALLSHKTGINVSRGQWSYVNVQIPEGTSRIVVILNDGEQSLRGATRLYIQQGPNPTASSFHTASRATAPFNVNNHALAVNNATAGNWVVGINGIKDSAKDLQVKVYGYDSSGNIIDADNNNQGNSNQGNTNQESGSNMPLAAISSPANDSQLNGTTVTFEHSEESSMWLYVGSREGASDLYNQQISGSSTRISDLPEDGSPVYVTLWTLIEGDWQPQNYRYTSVNNTATETESQPETVSNTRPQASLTALQSVQTPASSVTLDGSASTDADGDNLKYIWFQVSGPTVDLNTNDSAITSFSVDALDRDSTVQFRLTVFDGKDTHSSDVSILLKASSSNNNNLGDGNNNGSSETDNSSSNDATDQGGNSSVNTDVNQGSESNESIGDSVNDFVDDVQNNIDDESTVGSTSWLMLGLLGLFAQLSRRKR
ncbi:MAG: hypothetical protein HRU20_29835, partial [Pseudomonadales bacterium]|nr:hypothetical protein [Pseudomonadales bacterium]